VTRRINLGRDVQGSLSAGQALLQLFALSVTLARDVEATDSYQRVLVSVLRLLHIENSLINLQSLLPSPLSVDASTKLKESFDGKLVPGPP